jgi:hypothetical protein
VSYSEQASNVIELIHKIKEGTIKPTIIPDVTCWRENWRGCDECNTKKWKYPKSLEFIDRS